MRNQPHIFFVFHPQTEERLVLQFHYTEWPSHSCPYSNSIVEFRRRVRTSLLNHPTAPGPMVVHCK